MRNDAIRGHLNFVILSIVAAHEPIHGYAIIAAMRERSEGQLDLAEGTVYPALHRLLADGLLDAVWQDPAASREQRKLTRARRYYSLSDAGHEALDAERRFWGELVEVMAQVTA